LPPALRHFAGGHAPSNRRVDTIWPM
jgi:hypothetical protein